MDGVVGGRARARQDPTGVSTVGVGVDALLDQSGVIACRTGAELTETALLLVEQPLPAVALETLTGATLGALVEDQPIGAADVARLGAEARALLADWAEAGWLHGTA